MKNIWFLGLVFLSCSCHQSPVSSADDEKMIMETLQKETQYFCERNLIKWQEQWSHKSFVSKMYTGNIPFEEFIGWIAINEFTVRHIKKFPEVIPIPTTNPDYTIELFEDTALVFYSKNGENGLVREIRFMVKEGDKWKIARMQTIF